MSADTNSTGSVQAIDRAFQVLETIAAGGTMSLNDLHNHLGLNKASLSRIASTLVGNGYLNKDAKTGEFSLSLKTFEIGVCAVRSVNHMSLIRSYLDKLADETGAIAQFSIEDHNELLCLESVDRNDTGFSIYTRVGERSQLYATSAGKAILSTYSNEDIYERWSRMNIKQMTPNTLTTLNAFMQDITQTRQRNYALDQEESELGLFCIGTVLLNYNSKPIGAISLSVRSLTDAERERLSSILLQYTQQLSNMLGYMSK